MDSGRPRSHILDLDDAALGRLIKAELIQRALIRIEQDTARKEVRDIDRLIEIITR